MYPIEFTSEQWKFLANVCAGMSQVAIGSVVVPFFLDKSTSQLASLGVLAALIFVGFGLTAARKAQV